MNFSNFKINNQFYYTKDEYLNKIKNEFPNDINKELEELIIDFIGIYRKNKDINLFKHDAETLFRLKKENRYLILNGYIICPEADNNLFDLKELILLNCTFLGNYNYTNFEKCIIINCDFSRANLFRVRFVNSNCSKTSFNYLEKCFFYNCILMDSNFEKADLNGCIISDSNCEGASFFNASIDTLAILDSNIIDCNLRHKLWKKYEFNYLEQLKFMLKNKLYEEPIMLKGKIIKYKNIFKQTVFEFGLHYPLCLLFLILTIVIVSLFGLYLIL